MLALLLLGVSEAYASIDPDSRPIPRVETDAHAGFIRKLAADQAGQLVLTVSDDKTGRLWQASSGRLLHILRVPIESGHQGQLYAGTLSPNGQIAAVGGNTSSFEHDVIQRHAVVYFFSTQSGQVRSHQLIDSDRAIDNLAFSPDGRFLAVCLADGRGVRIYDLQQRALVKSENDTQDKILGVTFARNDDLVITTFDGRLWLFRAAMHYERTVIQLSGGRRPMHVQFSRDESELVVGFDGDPAFSIVDAKSLKEIYVAHLPASAGQQGLNIVEWSADGQFIYAGGETTSGFDVPIYRFPDRGRGSPQKIVTLSGRVTDIRRLPGGAMAFAGAEPEVGVIEATGEVRWRYRARTMDERRISNHFQLSPTGSSVVFGAASGTSTWTFDVLSPPESALTRTATNKLSTNQAASQSASAPIRSSQPGWNIEVSTDQERLSINGVAAVLENRETVRAWTCTPDGHALVVGTSWSLRLYDISGALKWTASLAADVNLAAVSADGHLIVATLSDGTIRWYGAEDGREILALLVTRSAQEWIAWIPAGYYMSSISGDNLIGWQVNRGADHDPDFYRAVQFERILYNPEVVQDYFRSLGQESIIEATRDAAAFDIADLDRIAPPRIQLQVGDVSGPDGRVLKVQVSGNSNSLAMHDWSLFVNEIPVVASQPISLPEQRAFNREATVQLSAGVNHLRAESSNGRSLGVAELTVDASENIRPEPGDLYLVAVGVSAFDDPKIPSLRFASNDAAEVARTFPAIARQQFRTVHDPLVLSDSVGQKPSKENIQAALGPYLEQAGAGDTVIVFISSHGLSSKGEYYFVPASARRRDWDAVVAQAPTEDASSSLLSWRYFVDLLAHTAGRRVLVVDTCASSDINGDFNVYTLAKRSVASQFALLTASKGSEKSQELQQLGHGVFTSGWLEGLRTGYDPNGDGVTTLAESFDYAFASVQRQHIELLGPQTPQFEAPDILKSLALVSRPNASVH